MAGATVYVILFRGVGGAAQLPTRPLRAALTEAGFENVSTYINSGNAVLRTRLSRSRLVTTVAAICSREFGFEKDVYAVSRTEWRRLIENNPFPDALEVPKFLHAAILGSTPRPEDIESVRALASGGERIEVVGDVAYLHTPEGFGTSKMAARFDKGIGVPNTARNWNTVQKLMELADSAA